MESGVGWCISVTCQRGQASSSAAVEGLGRGPNWLPPRPAGPPRGSTRRRPPAAHTPGATKTNCTAISSPWPSPPPMLARLLPIAPIGPRTSRAPPPGAQEGRATFTRQIAGERCGHVPLSQRGTKGQTPTRPRPATHRDAPNTGRGRRPPHAYASPWRPLWAMPPSKPKADDDAKVSRERGV